MKINSTLLVLFLLFSMVFTMQAIEVSNLDIVPVSVSVTGDVQNPGIYTLTTLNRVSEALAMADVKLNPGSVMRQQLLAPKGISMAQARQAAVADTTQATVYSQRNISLIRQGQTMSLDLLKYLRLGDISQNPFLRDGDIIKINPAYSTITIDGAVRKPGDYELKDGDTIKDLLEIAFGLMENADLKHVMLYSYKADFIEFDKTELDLTGYPKGNSSSLDQLLKPGDRILIPVNSEYRKAYKVHVTGKVKMPGTYYVNDKSSLYDLLLMSGGPTKEADLYSAYAYNRLVSENFDPDFDRLSRLSMLQMTWLEYSYLRTKTRQLKGKYSIDMQKCWDTQGKEANLTLKDGDEIVIPELINGVWVAGQVRHPGLITWKENMSWKEYLANAGGYANNSKIQGIRIIRYSSGNWVKPTKKLQINPGDAIFVPDKQERYIWDDVKEAILITSQLLTVLIALRTF